MADGSPGRLLLVPNTLDHGCDAGPIQDVIALGVLKAASQLAHWVVEDARSARAFLKRVNEVTALALPIQAIDIRELPRARKGSAAPLAAADFVALLAPSLAGHDLGLLSEAGLPAVADPGAQLVEAAHGLGVRVQPLAGPSSLLLALAASGFDGQNFAFVGYLPQEAAARTRALLELQALSRRGQTQLFIETPYRNAAMLSALLECLAPATRLSVSCGLTLAGGWTHSASVQTWRAQARTLPERMPAVFAVLAR